MISRRFRAKRLRFLTALASKSERPTLYLTDLFIRAVRCADQVGGGAKTAAVSEPDFGERARYDGWWPELNRTDALAWWLTLAS